MKLKRLLILAAGVALSFGAFAQAQTGLSGWDYYTGDRTGKDHKTGGLVRGKGLGPYVMEGKATLDGENYLLTLIDMNKASAPLTPMAIGESSISYQMVGSKLPYFVSLSQMAYPNLDSRQVYPPKADDGSPITVQSTWAWSLHAAQNGSDDILNSPVGMAVKAQLAEASAASGDRNKKNYVEIDLAEAKPGDMFNIHVDETFEGANCNGNKAGWADWDVKNTSFGIVTTGHPLVGFGKVAKIPSASMGNIPGAFVRYDANVVLPENTTSSFDKLPDAELAGKIVYMFATCDKTAITAINAMAQELSILSYEQGIGENQTLKRYGFRLAKTAVAVKANMSTETITGAGPTYIDVPALANITADNLAQFTNGTPSVADYGEMAEKATVNFVGSEMKTFENATATDDLVAVDNIYLVVPPKGLDASVKTAGVVSATSARCDKPNKASGTQKIKGYYGVEAAAQAKPADATMVPAIVIRHMMPPRTGPIYYVPNGLYAI